MAVHVRALRADSFEGAFSPAVPWHAFSLRVPEKTLQGADYNLTETLHAVAADSARLRALQAALRDHAADVLYEVPGSRLADHFLRQARLATSRVCDRSLSLNSAPGISWERARGFEDAS
eukprot:3157595-Prymnesium_polylepis.1